MKKLIFLFLFCFSALASDRVTITVTVTAIPAAANTLVVNAATRTWRAAPTVPASEITIGASIGASATNLFRQLATYPLAGPVALGFSSTNVITIQGQAAQAMAASISGTWAAITYSTNTVTPAVYVRVPLTAEPAYPQTNNPTQLAVGMGTYSQSPFAAGTTLVGNLVQTSGAQSITGAKSFDTANVTNLYAKGTEYVEGNILVTNTFPQLRFFDSGGGTDNKRTRIYGSSDGFIVSFWDDADSSEIFVINALRENGTHNTSLIELGGGTQPVVATLTNSFVKQSTLAGTNYSTGIFGHTRANNTSLANGNNATINFGTKVFVKIKAGPTAAFAICGIEGGADGRELVLYNATGQAMTISNDSGVEPTAANRIYTNTGADVVTTGNGAVRLIYDSEDSRWVVLSLQL